MLKRTKKGFTLAELLIVVAIIAVLTAIAVPLFVSSLNRAQKAVFEANRETVRSAGIVAILADENFDVNSLKANKFVKVTGTFEGNYLKSVAYELASEEKDATTFGTWSSGGKTQIIVFLQATDFEAA